MRVLVTGGSGIVGSYLRRVLAPAHLLTCFSRTAPAEPWDAWIGGDLMDADRLRRATAGHDAVIHLAAVPGPGRADPADLLTLNVIGTVNVLEAAVACGVDRVILASSAAATGFSFQTHDISPRYLPIDEAHPDAPQDEYGLSKLLAEAACKRYTDRHGLPTICLRINHNWCVDTAGADVAVRCGWAGRADMTRQRLWDERYRRAIREPDGAWPTPGPPPPRNLLWAVTDLRDAAGAFGLALGPTGPRQVVFLPAGPHTCRLTPPPVLLHRQFPNGARRAPLTGFESPFSSAKAAELLGYRPRSGWRGSDFDAWLQAQPEEPNA
ncbi:MAG: NAD(P)-dependent oxidoreductase [Spirochaetaceae bacterium]|nr:NAD(P)-dependent oxidoreductase [Spirochaetaceae bacterium]